jgi:hypothetical protein
MEEILNRFRSLTAFPLCALSGPRQGSKTGLTDRLVANSFVDVTSYLVAAEESELAIKEGVA